MAISECHEEEEAEDADMGEAQPTRWLDAVHVRRQRMLNLMHLSRSDPNLFELVENAAARHAGSTPPAAAIGGPAPHLVVRPAAPSAMDVMGALLVKPAKRHRRPRSLSSPRVVRFSLPSDEPSQDCSLRDHRCDT